MVDIGMTKKISVDDELRMQATQPEQPDHSFSVQLSSTHTSISQEAQPRTKHALWFQSYEQRHLAAQDPALVVASVYPDSGARLPAHDVVATSAATFCPFAPRRLAASARLWASSGAKFVSILTRAGAVLGRPCLSARERPASPGDITPCRPERRPISSVRKTSCQSDENNPNPARCRRPPRCL